MDLAEALTVLDFDTLADPEKRRKHFRQLQFDLQQKAERGELGIDQARLKEAMGVLGRAIDGGEVPRAEMTSASTTIRKALASAEPFEAATAKPDSSVRPEAGWTPTRKAVAIGGGVLAASLLGFAIGMSVGASGDDES